MRYSLEWLRDFVAIELIPVDLAARLTLGGFAVDAVETFAPPSDPAGGPDTVLEIDVPSNRPDVMNHLGLAREIAALTGRPLRPPVVTLAESAAAAATAASVSIQAGDLCPRYVGRVVRGVRTVESPRWMRRRLEAIGIAPKNAVVDASNYVLFELGQPLHAFDLGRLAGRGVAIRRARSGERIVTVVDRTEKSLSEDMLVIAEAGEPGAEGRPAAIAGVMGGLHSAISETTNEVLIESAWFAPRSVRRTARALELRTDASHRFERGADPAMLRFAADRLAALLVEVAGGEVLAGAIDVRAAAPGGALPSAGRSPRDRAARPTAPPTSPRASLDPALAVDHDSESPVDFEPPLAGAPPDGRSEMPALWREPPIILRSDRIEALLGVAIAPETVSPTLARVGIEAREIAEGVERGGARELSTGRHSRVWSARPPSWRWDVAIEVDLIEELARLTGYERIPETIPAGAAPVPGAAPSAIEDRARDLLVSFGYSEAINYAMISSSDDDLFGPWDSTSKEESGRAGPLPRASDRITILNPLSERWEVMRRTLVPGLSGTAVFNLARGRSDLRLFEVGSVHCRGEDGRPVELRAAALAAAGLAADPSWPTPPRPYDVLDLKGALEALASGLSAKPIGQSGSPAEGATAEGRSKISAWSPGSVRTDTETSAGTAADGPSRAPAGGAPLALVFEPAPTTEGKVDQPSIRPQAQGRTWPFHPGQSFVVRICNRVVGRGGRLHPDVEAALESDRPLFAAEILLEPFMDRLAPPRYRALPRLNPVERDLSFFVPSRLPYAAVAEAVTDAVAEMPASLGPDAGPAADAGRPCFFLLDRFEGKPVPPGKISYAFRFLFSPRERALTAEELNAAIERIAGRLSAAIGAEIRSR